MPYGIDIDIDEVTCVDLGHHWQETFYGRAPHGRLKGLPIRACVCMTCGSARIDHLNWAGKVTSRVYDHEEVYITNARLLGEFNQRRMALRRAKNARLKKQGDTGKSPWEES
jgi:hypothetical protein